MARQRQRQKQKSIEERGEDKLRGSRQPRFSEKDKSSIFWSTYSWAKKAAYEEPAYAPNSAKRDKWLREYVLKEPFLHGVLANVVSVDKNRGWTLLGAENIVRDYVERLHGLHAAPDQSGWRPFTSFMSQTFHSSDLGAVAEIEWRGVTLHNGFQGELNSLYTVDPAQCRLTGDMNYPLAYNASEMGLGPQEWSTNAYFRLTDAIYPDVNFNGLGVCALSRALELAKILTALYDHDAEQLLSKAPRGLLLLNGISEEQWEGTLEARAQNMSELERRYYSGVQVIAGNGLEKVSAELVSLSKIPENLDHVTFTSLVMNLYALAFKYDPREFWPVSGGQLGTSTETDAQHKKATGKGGMDFILSYQEHLQDLLPPTLEFEFEARDVDGEIKDENLTTMIVNNIVALATNKFITEEQARSMLAEAEIIHKDWAESNFQITTDKEDNPEGGDPSFLTPKDGLFSPKDSLFTKQPSAQALFGAKTNTLSFLNSKQGANSLSFLQQKRSPILDFLKKRNSKLVTNITSEPRLEDYLEIDKEAIARSLFYYPNQRIVKYVERQGIGHYEAIELKRKETHYSFTERGGEGSGNYGHEGRPGEVGGSGGGVSNAVTLDKDTLIDGRKNSVYGRDFAYDTAKELVSNWNPSEKGMSDFSKEENVPEITKEKMAGVILASWTGSSGGSVAQEVIQGALNQADFDKKSQDNPEVIDWFNEHTELSSDLQSLGKEMYLNTQKWFADKGITEVTLYRDVLGDSTKVDRVFSSWSAREGGYITSDSGRKSITAIVPVKQILSVPSTGFGNIVEQEVVVLGLIEGSWTNRVSRGGEGSGNFSHEGRPGEIGGSGGSSANTSSNYTRDTPFGNISGSKKVSAETYKEHVDDCMSKFDASRLPSNLQVVNTLDKDMQATIGLKIKSDGLLEHNGILINGIALRSQQAIILSQELGEDDALGQKPPGCPADVWKAMGKSPDTNPGLRYGKDKLNDTLTHEVAHILYDTNKTSGNIKTDTIVAKMKEAFPKISAQYKALSDYKTQEQFLKKIGISSYAMTNVDEFIAVTFQYSHRNEETQSFVSEIIGDTVSVEYFMGVPE